MKTRLWAAKAYEICDTASGISEACGQRSGCSHYRLVKISGGPDLAWNEAAAKDADEESQYEQALNGRHSSCKCSGNGAHHENGGECPSGAKSIACSSSRQAYQKRSYQGHDVGVCNIDLCEMEVILDCFGRQWWKSIPRPEGDEEAPP